MPISCLIFFMYDLLFLMYDAGVLFVFLSVVCLSNPSAVMMILNLFCAVCFVFCLCCLSVLSAVVSFVFVFVGVGVDVVDGGGGTKITSSSCGRVSCGWAVLVSGEFGGI